MDRLGSVLAWGGTGALVIGTFIWYSVGLGPAVAGIDFSRGFLVLCLVLHLFGLVALVYALFEDGFSSRTGAVVWMGFILWMVLVIELATSKGAYISTFGSILAGMIIALGVSDGLFHATAVGGGEAPSTGRPPK